MGATEGNGTEVGDCTLGSSLIQPGRVAGPGHHDYLPLTEEGGQLHYLGCPMNSGRCSIRHIRATVSGVSEFLDGEFATSKESVDGYGVASANP